MAKIDGNLKIKTSISPGYLETQALRSTVYDLFIDKLLELAEALQRESYIGASASFGEPSLKESWDVKSPRRQTVTFSIDASITNNADHALERIIGRGPGKAPPLEPIAKWVQVKIEPDPKRARAIAYVIGRAIAQKGTKRWQTGENFLDMNRDGTFRQESIVLRYERELAEILSHL